ncbi:molybdopterin-dependent oxidoreductase [Shigella flexneri]
MVRAAGFGRRESGLEFLHGDSGSRCLLRLHVKDDTVYWVESDTTGDDVYGNHQVRACLRGRSIRRRMNHPDRLKYPMKRVGKRGEGRFERVSSDEALDTMSDNLWRILKDYGNVGCTCPVRNSVMAEISPTQTSRTV